MLAGEGKEKASPPRPTPTLLFLAVSVFWLVCCLSTKLGVKKEVPVAVRYSDCDDSTLKYGSEYSRFLHTITWIRN